MAGLGRKSVWGVGGMKAATFLLLTSLAACGGGLMGSQPEPPPAPAPAPPPPPAPPPVDLAGRWQLAAAAGGSCFMTFADAPGAPPNRDASGAPQGTIAPEGGCPGNFFTSRKWTFEDGTLIIHDFKGRPLARLSYIGGHFEGQATNGGALTLSK